jgi:hypothetical protein
MENCMTEEITNAPIVEQKNLSMTPSAIAKRASRARQAAKVDAALPEEVRKERARERVEAGWKKNREALSKEGKAEVNEQIFQYNSVHKLMGWEYTYALADKKVLTPDDITFFKNIFLDVEAFATKCPQTEDSVYLQMQTGNPSDPVDFTELEQRLGTYPRFFRLYGQAVDHIYAVSYGSFLYYFSVFYQKYRHAGVAEEGGEFVVSWEKVDELVAKNERLSKLLVKPVARVEARPLSEAELIQKAVSERHASSLEI